MTPILLSLLMRMEWSMVSKALARSMNIAAAQCCFLSSAEVMSFNTFKVAVVHPYPARKPDYVRKYTESIQIECELIVHKLLI